MFQFARSSNSLFNTPVFGFYLAGVFAPWMNKIGILTGMLSSFCTLLWIIVGQYFSAIYSRTTLPTITENCDFPERNITYWSNSTEVSEFWINSTTAYSASEVSSRNVLEWFYGISYMYYTVLGLLIFITIGSIVSISTGRTKSRDIDDNLLGVCFKRDCTSSNCEVEKEVMMDSTKC